MATIREQQVLALIREDPMISQQALAKRLGISRSAVAGHIMKLTNKGFIRGRGYVVSESPFVAVVGGANMDIHGAPRGKLRLHDSNPGIVRTSPGGVARNIAENLARLGVDCRLVSAVGDDHHGRLLLQEGRDAGIDMQHVQHIASAQTSTYLSVLDDDGDMHVAINDMAIIDELGPEKLRGSEAMLKQAAVIIMDTNLRSDTIEWIVNTFAGQCLFVDTVSSVKAGKIKPHLKSIHSLKMSRIEAEALTGMSTRTKKDRHKLAAWVHEQGVERLFVTLGSDGVFYSTADAEGIERLQWEKRTLRNAGGAGDAFLAGMTYAWLEEWHLIKAVRFGLAAAELTLSDDASSSSALSVAAVNNLCEGQHVQ